MIKLIGYFIAGIGSVITSLLALAGRKAVFAALAIAVALSLTVGFIAALKSVLASVTASMIMPSWLVTIAWFVPSNFVAVFSALVAAHAVRAAYDLAITKLKLVNSSS